MGINQKEILQEIKILDGGHICTPKGFFAGGLHCGLKRKKHDLGWLYSIVPANAAAVYTTNLIQAAPILVTRESIEVDKQIQGVIVNSGNANACTGEEGYRHALLMRHYFAKKMNMKEEHVAVSSTGVIGEQLPINKVLDGINMIGKVEESAANFEKAILTTDTTQKRACVQLEIDGKMITIGGAAKGSGMIHPNMATMLAFITTDANVEQEALQSALKTVVDETFNMITVDGDTSTNDMVLLLANGLAKNTMLTPNSPAWLHFIQGLETVCQLLAKEIAKDGEGATKLIEAKVIGAAGEEDAKKLAKSVIGSNLVKSAVFGTDPNWGRIVCALGYSGVDFDTENISVFIGPYQLFANGLPVLFEESEVKTYMEENNEIQILVELHEGESSAIAWGCDLTYDYVKINASYRT